MVRTVLITGGTGGVGRALVERFAAGGDRVVFTYSRNRTQADALVHGFSDQKISAVQFEQGDPQSHQRLLQELPPRIGVLVNNAALGSATVTGRSDDPREQDRLLLQVNALGPLWLVQDLLPAMQRAGEGKIINISSVGGGVTQFPGFRLADGMSKAAVAHMTRQLAAELAHSAVDVFAVCPGATDTPMFDQSTLQGLEPGQRDAVLRELPGGRLIAPAEIAGVCAFLAGPDSACLHGAVIDASMGLGVNPGCLRQ